MSKWAVVTGASGGIGMDIARELAALGYALVLSARGADKLEALAAELQAKHGVNCLVLAVDLGAPDGPETLAGCMGLLPRPTWRRPRA
jgi:short-subunit dehydrogenase